MKKTKHYTGHRWSTEELKQLMALWSSGESLESIASTINVTTAAVLKTVGRLRQNGIPLQRRTRGHVANRTNKPWTQGEVEYLLRRREEKATSEEIANELGRTWAAVSAMIGNLRSENVPVAMRGNGVRRLWNADSLKGVAVQMPEHTNIEPLPKIA
jgi:biotin operon repressor